MKLFSDPCSTVCFLCGWLTDLDPGSIRQEAQIREIHCFTSLSWMLLYLRM